MNVGRFLENLRTFEYFVLKKENWRTLMVVEDRAKYLHFFLLM